MSEVQSAARPVIQDPAPEGLGVSLDAMPLRGMITLRGDFEDAAFVAAVKTATGGDLPAMRRAEVEGDRGALWMSPDELLLYVPYIGVSQTLEQMNTDLAGTHALAANVSDARAIFRIGGDKARVLLAKGAPVDLSPATFGVGDLRRTRIGVVAAAFYMTGTAPDTFEVICFRSYAGYLWRWLCTSAEAESLEDLSL